MKAKLGISRRVVTLSPAETIHRMEVSHGVHGSSRDNASCKTSGYSRCNQRGGTHWAGSVNRTLLVVNKKGARESAFQAFSTNWAISSRPCCWMQRSGH